MRQYLLFLFTLFYSVSVLSEADGPDYWRLNAEQAVMMLNQPKSHADILIEIPVNANALRNQGCEPSPSFEEWSNMTNSERENTNKNAWCKISYLLVSGWVPKHLLSEGQAPYPSFDCSAELRSIETLICQTPELIELDNKLDNVFKSSIKVAENLDSDSEKSVKLLRTEEKGWINGRNDCWKSTDIKQCVRFNYEHRIAQLQTKWILVPSGRPVHYSCGNEGHEFYLTEFSTDTLPAVAIEYGDNRKIFVANDKTMPMDLQGEFGRYLKVEGHNATLVWNQFEEPMQCTRSQLE